MAATDDRMHLLRRIQETEFVTLELNLYLNTHPTDAQALEHFNKASEELMNLKHQYEQTYGPLLNFGFGKNTGKTWRWVDCPWPWEM